MSAAHGASAGTAARAGAAAAAGGRGTVVARALGAPRPVRVRWGEGRPAEVEGEAVESLRESWLVEDRWWEAEPLRRRYWELVGARGRNLVVFHDLLSGVWFSQGSR